MRKRSTTPSSARPPPNPLFTSRTAEPLIVSTKNQNKMPNAKATMYLAETFLLAHVITDKPTKVGRIVDKSQVRKLSANPIMAVSAEGESFEGCGLIF